MKEKTILSYLSKGVRLQLTCVKINDDRHHAVVVRYLLKKNRRIFKSSYDEYELRKDFVKYVYFMTVSLPLFNN